jgi:hypothetical protein
MEHPDEIVQGENVKNSYLSPIRENKMHLGVPVLAILLFVGGGKAAHCADSAGTRFPLHVSDNKRYLVDRSGEPFFLNGDSAWEIAWQLNRNETEMYLEKRRQQGFNAIVVDALPYSEWSDHVAEKDREGNPPFLKPGDFATPNEAYFNRLGWLIKRAQEKGMLVLLSAADLGWATRNIPQFNVHDGMWYAQYKANGPEKCYQYGRFLGQHFGKFKNILWLLGGDRDPGDVRPEVLAMVRGLEETAPDQLKTYHAGAKSSGVFFQAEPWLDVNMSYGYSDTYLMLAEDYNRTPTKPVFLGESGYEGENNDQRGGTPLRVRRQAYWGVLSGAFGNVYGSCGWAFTTGWRDWLDSPGANQIKYFRSFFTSHKWYELKPDFDHRILTGGYEEGTEMATAAATSDGDFAVVYMPSARTVTLDLAKLRHDLRIEWFDPANGETRSIAESLTGNNGPTSFTPPAKNFGVDSDWVLLLVSSRQ